MIAIAPDTPLWLASRYFVSKRGEELQAAWKKNKSTYTAESIHDLRVASRRLHVVTVTFAPLFSSSAVSRAGRKIKQVTRLLGFIRNRDEALCFFAPLVDSLPNSVSRSGKAFLLSLQKSREQELRELTASLTSLKITTIMNLLHSGLNTPKLFSTADSEPSMPISSFFRMLLTDWEIKLLDLPSDENPESLHRLRIRIKKLRYTVELATLYSETDCTDFLTIMKQYQEFLGILHDLDTFRAMVINEINSQECATLLSELIECRHKSVYSEYLNLTCRYPVAKLGKRARGLL